MDDDDRQAEPVPDASGQPLPPPDAPAPGGGKEGPAASTAAPSTVAPSAGAPGTAAPGTAAPSTVAPSAGAAATAPEGGGAPSTPAPFTAPDDAPPWSGASETDDPELARIAAALPNYEIGGQLGRGGWGVVYEGRHRQLGREVAIKQLPPGFSTDPEVRARFLAEARALAALDHPHVVPVYDFVDKDGLCLLVMEKLSGGTVWSRFATEGLSMEAACAAVLATCAGLQSAHAHQILHRDIKPENLIFNAEGTLKVTDFGIAKMLSGQRTMATRAGEVMGTPAYMAPEQARGQQVTPATDVYAVGVMLYELLAGRRPFEDEEDPLALLFKQAYEDPQRLDEVAPHVPGPLVDVTMKALAKDPADRYQSAEDFGVAVAEAATEAWGPGWLMRASLPVMAAGSMVAATERITADLDAAGSRGVSVTVKPQDAVRERAPDAHRPADASDLVPVEDVVPRPPSALPAWLGTAVLLAAVVFVAFFVRIGSPGHTGTIDPGTLTLAGQDPSAGRVVQIDMSDDFVVEGVLPAPEATQIEVAFSAVGVRMGSGRSTVAANPDGTFRAEVDPSASRWMLSGRGTGELRFSAADGEVLSSQQFEVDSTQTSFMTGPFVAAVLALFFLLGYVESMMRALRRGRRRLPSLIGLPIIAVPIGVALSIVAWAGTGSEPTRASVAATAAVAAAAGLVAGWGALRSGRVRQHKRAEAAKARAEAAPSSAR